MYIWMHNIIYFGIPKLSLWVDTKLCEITDIHVYDVKYLLIYSDLQTTPLLRVTQ